MKIAIDGPAGSGKSTIAKILAERLNISYIDTGAMYRALAYFMNKNSLSISELKNVIEDIKIEFYDNRTILNGEDISEYIRTSEVSDIASLISKDREIREKLVELQRDIANENSCVMEGRDITSVVLKDADYKFYLDADPVLRAKRRLKDLKKKGEDFELDELIEMIKKRDIRDKTRENSPLIKTDDSIYIDTSKMEIDGVIEKILSYVGE